MLSWMLTLVKLFTELPRDRQHLGMGETRVHTQCIEMIILHLDSVIIFESVI